MRSRSLTAGTCGTTSPGTPRRRSWRTAAASRTSPAPGTPAARRPQQRRPGQNPRPPAEPDGQRSVRPQSAAGGADPRTARRRPRAPQRRGLACARPPATLGLDRRRPAASPTAATVDERRDQGRRPGPGLDRYQPCTTPPVEPRAATTPPCCTPRSPPSATAAACAPSTATSTRFRRHSRGPAPASSENPPDHQLAAPPHRLNPRQSRPLADLRSRCAQLDGLATHVTSFAKMMTHRTGEQQLADWLDRARSRRPAPPALLRHRHPPGPRGRHHRTHPALQLRHRRRQRQQDQNDQTTDVRPRQPRPPPQTRHPSPTVTPITEFAPEPITLASDSSSYPGGHRSPA